MKKNLLSLVVVFASLVFTLTAYANQVITINVYFATNGTQMYAESDNNGNYTATNSGLTAAQQNAVIAEAQAEYNAANINQNCRYVVQAMAGNPPNNPAQVPNNTINMVVTGGALADGNKFGNAGLAGRPGVVYVRPFANSADFTNNGMLTAGGLQAIGQTLAHEAGHKLGLQHNQDNPASKMTVGTRVPNAARQQNRPFNNADVMRLQAIIMRNNPMTAGQFEQANGRNDGHDLGVHVGQVQLPFAFVPTDDMYLNATVQFTGSPNLTFGYIGDTGTFVPVGDSTTASPDNLLTFIGDGGINLAVEDSSGNDYTLEAGFGTYSLSVPNPLDPSLDALATVNFMTPAGSAMVVLTAGSSANDFSSTGGFYALVPEPSSACLFSIGILGLLGFTWHRKRSCLASV